MRLLKTGPYVPGDEKLEVIQKWGQDIPAYAILSHTWSTNPDDEVLLSDVQNGTCGRKAAFAKLENAMVSILMFVSRFHGKTYRLNRSERNATGTAGCGLTPAASTRLLR